MARSGAGGATRAKRHGVVAIIIHAALIAAGQTDGKDPQRRPILSVRVFSLNGHRSPVPTTKRRARVSASSDCYDTGRGSGAPITATIFRSSALLASLGDVRVRTLRPVIYLAVQPCTLGRPTTSFLCSYIRFRSTHLQT